MFHNIGCLSGSVKSFGKKLSIYVALFSLGKLQGKKKRNINQNKIENFSVNYFCCMKAYKVKCLQCSRLFRLRNVSLE